MRRADRLFQLIQILRGRRVVTARRLAELLQVSERSIYRDVRDLQLSGVPIEGEAGVGYCLRKGSDIPPLMFTRAEIEAVVVGARMVEAFAGNELAAAARQALVKIEAVLPEPLKRERGRTRVLVPPSQRIEQVGERLDRLRAAIAEQRVIEIAYTRGDGQASVRCVWSLCLVFWGHVWTLSGWCERRQDFRNFRLDRISELRVLDRQFVETAQISLAKLLSSVGADRFAE